MHGTTTDERLRCARCGDVIGAYEPLVALLDGRARNTSKAAEADGGEELDECYHRSCYALAYPGVLTESIAGPTKIANQELRDV